MNWQKVTLPYKWRQRGFFETDYSVSECGKVRNDKTGRILKPFPRLGRADIYLGVDLYHNGKRYYCYVHRLVAQAHVPNPKNKKEVNHFDCNTLNNHVSNLEWVTRRENEGHKIFMSKCS